MNIAEKNILIIEDEQFFRDTLRDKLKEEGFSVVEAKDGNEGLHAALKIHPDLILLDIVLPELDGITLLKQLREDEWGKNAKVILLTNYPFEEKAGDAFELGVAEYILKSSWNINDITGKVKEKLGMFGTYNS